MLFLSLLNNCTLALFDWFILVQVTLNWDRDKLLLSISMFFVSAQSQY